MGKMSRDKGARGELEFSNFCKDHGFNTERTAQRSGNGGDSADIKGLEGIHVEVKRTEKLKLFDALKQSQEDCKEGNIPIVAHKRNRDHWYITMKAEDWMKLYKEWLNESRE